MKKKQGGMEGAESETSDGRIEGGGELVYRRRRIWILADFRKSQEAKPSEEDSQRMDDLI